MNAGKFDTPEDFYEIAEAAAIIGTLQAGYTEFKYLGWVSEEVCKREALLGVSMTGVMATPSISLNSEYQRKAAEIVNSVNKRIAEKINIKPASRTTAIKPAGTGTKLLGLMEHGISPAHAREVIQSVTANDTEPVFQYLKSINPHMCVKKPNGDYVIQFPMKTKSTAIVKEDLSAIEFMKIVLTTQENWVLPGTQTPDTSPGLAHNVSNTVIVKSEEWDDVQEFIWANRKLFTGVSLLSATGDHDYEFVPMLSVTTEADENRFNELISKHKVIDYSLMIEEEDNTSLVGELACSGGACLV